MEEKDKQEKKLIIDEDWKQQAQAEKEKLDSEAMTADAKKEAEQPERGPMPEGNFESLLSLLVTQTYIALGAIRAKDQEAVEPDLEFAKYHIDTLADLEKKTKGNLTPEEEEMLHTALHSLRMMYVRASSK